MKAQPANNKLWINWEPHRRSQELARVLGCDYYCFDFDGVLRYPLCILRTLHILLTCRPRILIVQNPSMVLAALACMVRSFQHYFLVVDRHTTFRLNKPHSGSLRTNVFMRLHRYTLKTADLTIVTNEYLSSIVKNIGGRAFVLPDRLPDLHSKSSLKLKSPVNLLMISSFGQDEPLEEVIKAVAKLDGKHDFTLYVTGNFRKAPADLIARAPSNLEFTGFLSEQAFIDMLYAVDGVLALTTSDYCMLCGCYEAVAAKKPLVTSDKSVLREYFDGAIFVDNGADAIATGIAHLIDDLPGAKERTTAMHDEISVRWEEKYRKLDQIISDRL